MSVLSQRADRGRGRILARLSLAAIVAALAAGSLQASQASAAGGEVKVEFHGDSTLIHLDDLGPPDIQDSSYKLEGNWVTRSGHSLRTVLEAVAQSAGFQMISVVSVEIDARPGTRTIARSQLDNGPPIFFGEDGGTSWILPGSGGGDAQLFAFSDFAPIIRVNYGLEFQVDLSVAPAKVHAGDEVQLKARVTGQQPGEKLDYDWNFGDGKIVEGTSSKISHQFKTQGSYQITLEVRGPSGGGSARATVQVGKAQKPEKEQNPGGEKKPKDEKKQKDGREGSEREDSDSGTGTGDSSGSGAGTGTGSATASVPAGIAPLIGASDPAPRDHERPDTDQPAARQGDEGLVTGTLIDPADLAPVPARAAIQPKLEKAGQGGSGVGKALFSATGILILLALGSLTERLVFRQE